MPQTLASILQDTPIHDVYYDPESLQREPELALLIAQAIARWASIEGCLTRLLVLILGANARPSFAMFSALSSSVAQMAALKAAADETLSSATHEAFFAAMLAIRPLAEERNRFVHWLWGHCDQVPHALTLTDPKYVAERMIAFQEFPEKVRQYQQSSENGAAPFDSVKTRLDKILVYRRGDLERSIRDLKEAGKIVGTLSFLLNPDWTFVPDDELHRQLSNLRLYQEALDRLHAAQKKNPSTPKR